MAMSDAVELHGRRYRKPERPVVVICVDGFDPAYLDRGLADGILPAIAGLAGRLVWHGRGRDADLHQPEQRLDRDRRLAGAARDRRQLLSRPRNRTRR